MACNGKSDAKKKLKLKDSEMTSEVVLDYINKYGIKRKTRKNDQLLIDYYESLKNETKLQILKN